jgi:hypothetical protein
VIKVGLAFVVVSFIWVDRYNASGSLRTEGGAGSAQVHFSITPGKPSEVESNRVSEGGECNDRDKKKEAQW